MKKLLTILMLLASALPLWALSFDVMGLSFESIAENELRLVRGETAVDNLNGIIIPETVEHNGVTYTVTAIGDRAFYGWHKLRSVIIPKGVTSIGEEVFAECWSLCKIIVLAKTPPSINNSSILYDAYLYVPEGSEETYRNTSIWNYFTIKTAPHYI